MNGLCGRFSVFWMMCRALSMVLAIAAILASAFPAAPIHAEYFAGSSAQTIAMNDHAVSADKKVQDHKAHPACSPGLGCLAFIVLAEEALAITPFSAIIKNVDTARLATRAVAPPLPPPRPVILA
jgi:hypothetical protein